MPPDRFCRITRFETQGEASVGSMRSRASMPFSSVLTLSRMARGTRRSGWITGGTSGLSRGLWEKAERQPKPLNRVGNCHAEKSQV